MASRAFELSHKQVRVLDQRTADQQIDERRRYRPGRRRQPKHGDEPDEDRGQPRPVDPSPDSDAG